MKEKEAMDGGSVQMAEEKEGLSTEDFQLMLKTLAQQAIPVRVHSVLVQGNSRTRSFVIQDHLECLKNATTSRDLLREAFHAIKRIENSGLFEKCIISLEEGPTDRSVIVVVRVEESCCNWAVDAAGLTDHQDGGKCFEGLIKLKNIFGFGETLHSIGSYGFHREYELSTELRFPRLKGLQAFVSTQTAFFTPERLDFSPYKVRLTGISVGILSDRHNDLSFSLSWRNLRDNSDALKLVPSLKYAFKTDRRDCAVRPTKGFAFRLATQISGFGSDLHQYSACQDIDFRFAIPLGFHNAALNIGLSGGLMLPWTKDILKKTTVTNNRFFMGRHSSLVCDMNGPSTILGLRYGGVDSRKYKRGENSTESSDHLGGGLAFSGFADLSFDIPIEFMRKRNVYGHCFICAGNQVGITEAERQSFSFRSLLETSKCFAGAGIVIPTRIFRVEVNICQALGKSMYNRRGIQLSFSSSRNNKVPG